MKMTKTMKIGKRTKTKKVQEVRHLRNHLIAAQKTMKYQREEGDQKQRERENGIARRVNKVQGVIQIVRKKKKRKNK